ncbi:MAG: hypothetical protein J5779_03310 [Clostridia bacterium]|nr:hypothetical protein [Clostridia bacterium]
MEEGRILLDRGDENWLHGFHYLESETVRCEGRKVCAAIQKWCDEHDRSPKYTRGLNIWLEFGEKHKSVFYECWVLPDEEIKNKLIPFLEDIVLAFEFYQKQLDKYDSRNKEFNIIKSKQKQLYEVLLKGITQKGAETFISETLGDEHEEFLKFKERRMRLENIKSGFQKVLSALAAPIVFIAERLNDMSEAMIGRRHRKEEERARKQRDKEKRNELPF